MANSATPPNTTAVELGLKVNDQNVPASLLEAIEEVVVTAGDEGRSGFQITFNTVRIKASGDAYDAALLLAPASDQKILLSVKLSDAAVPIMAGYVLKQEVTLDPNGENTKIVLTGEDLSYQMDLKEVVTAFATQAEDAIVSTILKTYASDFTASVTAPPTVITPTENDYLPIQRGTDLAYLQSLAKRFDYRVYLKPADPTSSLYWGPRESAAGLGGSLIFGPTPYGNINSMKVSYDALGPTTYAGNVQDRTTNAVTAVAVTTSSTVVPALADSPALTTQTKVRQSLLRDSSGLLQTEAQARAQGDVDTKTALITVEGELDTLKYGAPLMPATKVELVGVHSTYDGDYYVKSVTHNIKPPCYTQQFVLTREGLSSSG